MKMNEEARAIVIVFVLHLLILEGGGYHVKADCSLDCVHLSQTFVKKDPRDLKVFKVTIKNDCSSAVIDLFLSCGTTFKPRRIFPATILKRGKEDCRVNDAVKAGDSLTFLYSAETIWPDLDVVLVGCISGEV